MMRLSIALLCDVTTHLPVTAATGASLCPVCRIKQHMLSKARAGLRTAPAAALAARCLCSLRCLSRLSSNDGRLAWPAHTASAPAPAPATLRLLLSPHRSKPACCCCCLLHLPLVLRLFILLVIVVIVAACSVTMKFMVVRCKFMVEFSIQAIGTCQVTKEFVDIPII